MKSIFRHVFTAAIGFLLVFCMLTEASAITIISSDDYSSNYVPDYFNQMYGDVSGDMKITAEDARLALRLAVGYEDEELLLPVREFKDGTITEKSDAYELSSRAILSANVNGDQEITAEDARLILRAAVGLEDIDFYEALAENAAAAADYDDDGQLETVTIDYHYTKDLIVDGITLTYFDEGEAADSLTIDNRSFPEFPVFASDYDGYYPGYFADLENEAGEICINCSILMDAVSSHYFVFDVENGKLKTEAHLLDPGYSSGTGLYMYEDYNKDNMEALALYGVDDFNKSYGKYDSYLAALEGELGKYGFQWKKDTVFDGKDCYVLSGIQADDGFYTPNHSKNRGTDGGLSVDDVLYLFNKTNYLTSCWVDSTIGTELDLDDSFIDVETEDCYYRVTGGAYRSVEEINAAIREVFTDDVCNALPEPFDRQYRMAGDALYGMNMEVSTPRSELDCMILPISVSEYELQFSDITDEDVKSWASISLVLENGVWKFNDYFAFDFNTITFGFQDA